ncbi:MAG TPA: type II secretion system protein [Tepidisphaeraceae bacterium]|nr:type II secretion system protein [Tepidisphaeraceae bacterium]
MRSRRGFTLLEFLTTVAVLIILLGLMVDLAGYVRNRSATDLARQVLGSLDEAMGRYFDKYKADPGVHAFAAESEGQEDEEALFRLAQQNNRDFVAALKQGGLLKADVIAGLPASIYDGESLNDAWDMPIVFVQSKQGKMGRSPSDRGFFFSAGPDRLYRTREDNLYSYEVSRATQ